MSNSGIHRIYRLHCILCLILILFFLCSSFIFCLYRFTLIFHPATAPQGFSHSSQECFHTLIRLPESQSHLPPVSYKINRAYIWKQPVPSAQYRYVPVKLPSHRIILPENPYCLYHIINAKPQHQQKKQAFNIVFSSIGITSYLYMKLPPMLYFIQCDI